MQLSLSMLLICQTTGSIKCNYDSSDFYEYIRVYNKTVGFDSVLRIDNQDYLPQTYGVSYENAVLGCGIGALSLGGTLLFFTSQGLSYDKSNSPDRFTLSHNIDGSRYYGAWFTLHDMLSIAVSSPELDPRQSAVNDVQCEIKLPLPWRICLYSGICLCPRTNTALYPYLSFERTFSSGSIALFANAICCDSVVPAGDATGNLEMNFGPVSVDLSARFTQTGYIPIDNDNVLHNIQLKSRITSQVNKNFQLGITEHILCDKETEWNNSFIGYSNDLGAFIKCLFKSRNFRYSAKGDCTYRISTVQVSETISASIFQKIETPILTASYKCSCKLPVQPNIDQAAFGHQVEAAVSSRLGKCRNTVSLKVKMEDESQFEPIIKVKLSKPRSGSFIFNCSFSYSPVKNLYTASCLLEL